MKNGSRHAFCQQNEHLRLKYCIWKINYDKTSLFIVYTSYKQKHMSPILYSEILLRGGGHMNFYRFEMVIKVRGHWNFHQDQP